MKTIAKIIWAATIAICGCSNRPTGSVDVGAYETDAGTDAPIEGLPDGASCDVDAQCLHHKCIPSKNSFGIGICFSADTEGCIVVTEPSPFKESCKDATLFTCGDKFDVSTLGANCEIVGVGDLFEYYHCCPKP